MISDHKTPEFQEHDEHMCSPRTRRLVVVTLEIAVHAFFQGRGFNNALSIFKGA